VEHNVAAVVVSMLEELISREGLEVAVAGRDAASLFPILEYIDHWFQDPRFTPTLLYVTNVLLGV
jgi:hypothetical protein